MPQAEGLHGGGDRMMLQHLFCGGSDLIGLSADERAGAWSVLIGIAANTSLAQTKPVSLRELAAGIEHPVVNVRYPTSSRTQKVMEVIQAMAAEVGIDDAHYYRVDNIEKAASEIPDNGFSILLSHTPEI